MLESAVRCVSMKESRRLAASCYLIWLSLAASAQDPNAPETASRLAAADKLVLMGKFADAERDYRALLKSDPKLTKAQTGLIRAELGERKIDEALDLAKAGLEVQPGSAMLLAAKGDVHFRRGEMADAETSYRAAQKADPKEVRAYVGLALLYNSYSLYRKAHDQMQTARSIAPDDPSVQLAWIRMLPRDERLAAMQSYLSAPNHREEAEALAKYMGMLQATTEKTSHPCKLVSKVEETEIKLEAFSAKDARRPRAIALPVTINHDNILLPLDTGATGIVLGRRLAEHAHLPRISAAYVGGFGGQRATTGYRAVADHIQIGQLEFQDCVVVVADVPGADGLVGPDVFESYLVDINLAGMQLRLSPLPKHPGDAAAPTSLNSEAEEATSDDQEGSAAPMAQQHLPIDRYVSPEMADWTRAFRFGHMLVVPTSVNESKPMLFVIDTGSVGSMLSLRAAQQVSKVRSEEHLRFGGMGGTVNNVYAAKNATLRFGHLEQKNKDIITIDLSNLSQQCGTEISGILGYQVLMMLDVKLDYRDGLVDFEYIPKEKHK